ncbi:hypothetical protein E5161_03185 [Cohnella pontilimi]|uniref:DUF559 domain-containing protein n=1 Tax=Cohnella pontilimi TaxID=2564100 RepID=A0A4U0FHI7_9BACL|nr:hypothetical protein [Cohnella pontilimi]TJY44398.1 hypothetical protein E5161_03185 [Cohnella pontilimi]
MEHEMVSLSGVRIYGDYFWRDFRLIVETDGFAAHAENMTRDRFSFERMRIRTFALYGYRYMPFSWDELDKKPEMCRRTLYELLGRYSTNTGEDFMELLVYERELLRYALRLGRPFRMTDVCYCLQLGHIASRRVVRSMLNKKLIVSTGQGTQRLHEFQLTAKAADLLLL